MPNQLEQPAFTQIQREKVAIPELLNQGQLLYDKGLYHQLLVFIQRNNSDKDVTQLEKYTLHRLWGAAYYNVRNYVSCIDHLKTALENHTEIISSKEIAEVYFMLGYSYLARTNYGQAINWLNQAVYMNPDNQGYLKALNLATKLSEPRPGIHGNMVINSNGTEIEEKTLDKA